MIMRRTVYEAHIRDINNLIDESEQSKLQTAYQSMVYSALQRVINRVNRDYDKALKKKKSAAKMVSDDVC